MQTAGVPTTRELDTLATLIDSAGKHMIDARDRDGNLVWSFADEHDAYNEMVLGFYDIQLRAPGGLTRDLVTI
jgi:hypothetical protein